MLCYGIWSLIGKGVGIVLNPVWADLQTRWYGEDLGVFLTEMLIWIGSCIVFWKWIHVPHEQIRLHGKDWVLFGVSHYANVFVTGWDLKRTSVQVIHAICMGCFLAAVCWRSKTVWIGVVIHGGYDFLNMFMNEMLGWDYELPWFDPIEAVVSDLFYIAAAILILDIPASVRHLKSPEAESSGAGRHLFHHRP